jgi:hypothetical protein
MEPQDFFQPAHGQLLLWQRGFSTVQWNPFTTAALRRAPIMPITIPNYGRRTDRLPFGTLIGKRRNPHEEHDSRICTAQFSTRPAFRGGLAADD